MEKDAHVIGKQDPVYTTWNATWKKSDTHDKQLQDPDLSPVLHWLEQDENPS